MPMPSKNWDRLSAKDREVWKMRYRFGWRMKRIAVELGISANGASKMLARIHQRAGLPKYRVSVIRKKPFKPECARPASEPEDYLDIQEEQELELERQAQATRTLLHENDARCCTRKRSRTGLSI